jgi:TolB-like protein
MPLSPGQKLASYEIISSLGAGGMGEVYRARDARLGRDVALKVLPPEVTSEPGRLERFDREARAIAALNHPHIVTIYSTEHVDGIRFLTMELVEGCTLGDLVVPGGIPLARFLEIATPLADALAAAHHKQITHRDLKPGNVMVSNDNRVKVLDFGLARIAGSETGEDTMVATAAPLTHQGMIVGTMPYMSPEQVEGRPLDPRSDLFSLGVIFYELLSGDRPFKGASSPALMSAILRDTPPPITEKRHDVPEALERLIGRLIEKRPEDRVQTARDVVNELRHIKDGGSSARKSSTRVKPGNLTIAVSAFEARSSDDLARDLADGLPGEIANGLSRFGYLRVLSGKDVTARYVLSGQVRTSGPATRVSVKLLDSQSGATLWAENCDGKSGDDFFSLQDAVANRIVATVGDESGVLMRSMAASIADVPLDQLSVSELVVRYFAYAEDFRPDEHLQLRTAFEQALEREPRAAEGWACLAMLCEHEHGFGYNPLPNTVQRHRQAAERALALDARSPHAWAAMVTVHLFAQDLPGVRAAVERVVSLNPANTDLIARSALFLDLAGDHDRALELTHEAMARKPQHPASYHFVPFNAFYARGEDEKALQEAKLLWMPKLPVSHMSAAAAAGQLGRVAEAKVAIDALRQTFPELLSVEAARQIWSTWIWNEPFIDRLVDGFAKALELAKRPEGRSGVRSDVRSDARLGEQSIAVLPFADLSEKKDQDWFCDGIAEEILNALAPLPGLRVAARASAFSFRGKTDDLRSIGDKLNVDTVLEGSVRRAGDRVRITAQLSDATEGRQLWSERFDRELKDIFDVQDEIARAIVARLRVTIAAESAPLVTRATTNIEAYQLLLKGRSMVTRRGRAVLDAIPLFERAIELDPNLSEAHALLGDAYRLLGLYGVARANEVIPKARACVDRALAIEPNQPEALATLSIIASVYDWDLDEMRRRSDRTMAADPDHVRGNTERALALGFLGLPGDDWLEEADRHVRKARTLDPLNAWVMAADGAVQMLRGHLEAGASLARNAIDLDHNNFTAHWFHTWGLAELGQQDAAIAASEPALAMSGRHPQILSNLCAIHSSRGNHDAIEPIVAELATRAETAFVGSAARATVAAAAGRLDEARELLAIALAEHDPYVAFFKMYGWRPIWKDDRCAAMLKATRLFQRTSA